VGSEAGLASFFDSAERLIADSGPTPETFGRIGALLRPLSLDPSLIDDTKLAALHHSDAGFTIVGHGPTGSTLMLARFPAEAPTPIHNHNSWAVIYVIRGRDRHIQWAREDDGLVPGRARIHATDSRELGPGDIAWLPPPPADIHSQQGIDQPAWELVYFGLDPTRAPRLYFDPDRGLVEERSPVENPRSRARGR
jgi:hypothetical protein